METLKNTLVLLLLMLAAGCTTIQPFPHAARAGDTVTLAVGSQTDIGTLSGMNLSNTTVTFTSDSNSIPVDITGGVRAIFNLYADKASNSYSPNIQNNLDNFKVLHHEPWQTVMALDLPTTLALGSGVVNIQTSAPQSQAPFEPLSPGNANGVLPDLNTVDIAMEILPGTGVSNTFRYKGFKSGNITGNLSDLEPGRQALVQAPRGDSLSQWGTTFGAVEFKITMPMVAVPSTGTVDDTSVRLVKQDVSSFSGSKAAVAYRFDGTEITVMFISATGKLQYYEPRFSVMAETADFTATPTITSVQYFDVDGNIVTGPTIADYSVELLGTF